MTSSPGTCTHWVSTRSGRAGAHSIETYPIDRGGDPVLVTGLERVDDTENLGGVATSRGRV